MAVLGALAAWPTAVSALDAVLTLDSGGYVDQQSPHAEGRYPVPGGTTLNLVFGSRSGDSISVVVPVGGLQMGTLRGTDIPDVRVSQTAPGFGSLTVGGADSGALELYVPLTVEGNGQSVQYVLRLTSKSVALVGRSGSEIGSSVARGTGQVALVASAEVKGGKTGSAGNFFVVVSGHIEPLPSELK
jgi:hypothetical protein